MILTIEVEITRTPSGPMNSTLDPQEIIRFINTMLVTGYPGYRIRVIGDETT